MANGVRTYAAPVGGAIGNPQSTICNTVSVILIHTERFAEHQTPPGHPERSERAEVMDAVAHRWRTRGTEIVAPRSATREQLARVHGPEYLRRIAETAGTATALDADTYTS